MAMIASLMISGQRLLLTLAGASLVAAVIAGYVEDQKTAENLLADRIELPATVLLQNFDSSQHLNMLNELQVLGEVDLQKTVTANVGTEDQPRWVELIPVFGVSEDAKPLAVQTLLGDAGLARRPMPRGLNRDINTRASGWPMQSELEIARTPTRETTPALAVLIRSVEKESASGFTTFVDLGATPIGDGARGVLVRLAGSMVSGQRGLTDAATAGLGIYDGVGLLEGSVFMTPLYEARKKGSTQLYATLRRSGFLLAAVFALLSLAPTRPTGRRPKRVPEATYVPAAGRLPSVQLFQPIRAQSEIEEDEHQAANMDSEPNAISRLQDLLESFRTANWFRNRP